MRNARRIAVLIILTAAGMAAGPVAADEISDFYKGKTVSFVVGHEVGTSNDLYARLAGRHLHRHIPGNPNVIVRNMVGASGLIAANWLYNIAPTDGTVIATFSNTALTDPLLGTTPARFEAPKFTFIGNLTENYSLCIASKASGIETVDDLLKSDTIFGVTAASGPFAKFTNAVKNILGLRIKIVAGYKGAAELKIAFQRGEVQGSCGVPHSLVTSNWRDDHESGAFRVVLQLNGKPLSWLKNVAHIDNYARSPEDNQLFDLLFRVNSLGRVYLAPPAIPMERRNALRSALMAMIKDPQFLTDAAKNQLDIIPMTGEEVEMRIVGVYASSPAVIKRAKAALRAD